MRGEFIDLDGNRIYYYAAGSRGAGEPIVLIHGFPASSHVWFDVVAKLPPGHRVVVYDLLGFGRSDLPDAADLSVAGHGRRLIELLDALHIDKACLVGHGIGAAISVWAALNAPARVSRIGLIESATVAGWFSKRRSIGASIPEAALRLPAWCWMPLARFAIARRYDDWSRGLRSAEMFLVPFATVSGAAVLRQHLRALSGREMEALNSGAAGIDQPLLAVSADNHCYSPEEYPSEIASAVARLLEA